MSLSYGRGYEPWIGRRFDIGGANAFIGVQILRWLNVFSHFNSGPEIFYDRVDPFLRSRHPALQQQPRSGLDRAASGADCRLRHPRPFGHRV